MTREEVKEAFKKKNKVRIDVHKTDKLYFQGNHLQYKVDIEKQIVTLLSKTGEKLDEVSLEDFFTEKNQ